MRLSSLLIVDPDPARAAHNANVLAEDGGAMHIAHTRDSAIEILKSNYIELLIIATTGPAGAPYPPLDVGMAWEDAVAVARAARDIASELDTVVAAVGLPTSTSDTELPNAPFDYFMPRVSHPHQLRVRVDVILRLLTMQRELRRRIMVAAPFRVGEGHEKLLALDARPSATLGRPRIVYIDMAREQELDVVEALACAGDVVRYSDTGQAASDLRGLRADLCVLRADNNDSDAIEFMLGLRNQPGLFNLPQILITPELADDTLGNLYGSGVTDILVGGIDRQGLLSHLRSVIRLQHMRAELTQACRETPDVQVTDHQTGAFSHGFGMAYLDDLLIDGRKRSWPVSGALFRIADIAQINAQYGYAVGDYVLRHMVELLCRFKRSEDVIARIDGTTVLAVFPDTDPNGARAAVSRLTAVLRFRNCTLPGSSINLPLRIESSLVSSTDVTAAIDFLRLLRQPQRRAA